MKHLLKNGDDAVKHEKCAALDHFSAEEAQNGTKFRRESVYPWGLPLSKRVCYFRYRKGPEAGLVFFSQKSIIRKYIVLIMNEACLLKILQVLE